MAFGSVLREARERKGYDLTSAARRLRIRPDILRAIEENDFASMPPRGYARNMVNAYARLVGLNPTELTRMYLDEAYAYQVGRTRSETPKPSGFDMGGSSRSSRTSRMSRQSSRSGEGGRESTRQNALGRTVYEDRQDYRNRSTGEGQLYVGSQSRQGRRVSGAGGSGNQFTNFYTGSQSARRSGNGGSRLPFIVAGAAVLVLLIVVLLLMFTCRGGESTEDVPNVPISGLTDTTQTDEGSEDSATTTPVETAPTSVQVTYEVADGQEVYAVITTDGTSTEQMISGPVEETVDVTGTWSFATWVSDAVTVTVDGEKVEFSGTDDSGMPVASVDFAAYLEQWYTDHPNAQRSTASTTQNSTSSDSTNAASDTTSTASTEGSTSE